MQLSDERTLAIGMIALALGILIGRFLYFEYAGFSVTDFTEVVLIWAILCNERCFSSKKKEGTSAIFG